MTRPPKPLAFLRREPGLFAFDLDSTLVDGEGIDELARAAGAYAEVSGITERAMRGELDFAAAFAARLRCLRGLGLADVDAVYHRLPLMPGAVEVVRALRRWGHRIAILSGGFDVLAERYARDLGGVDFLWANTLEMVDGSATGRVVPPLVDGDAKARGLLAAAREFGVPTSHTVAIGDGANDAAMLARASFGIGFRPKDALRPHARAIIEERDLRRVLDLL